MKSCLIPTTVDTVIVGGGLAGVLIASELEKQQQQQQQQNKFVLLEASDRFGGRLKNDNSGLEIDLGAAWLWPEHQPRIRHLVQQLNLSTLPQDPMDPYTVTERIQGGAVELVNKLVETVAPDKLVLNAPVVSCTRTDNNTIEIQTTTTTTNSTNTDDNNVQEETKTYIAQNVVFCVPPRLLHKHVTFNPPLSASKQQAMKQSNTWMAGVTKVALVYSNQHFWGDYFNAFNYIGRIPGPVFQLYDSSTSSVNALTAFTLVKNDDTLKDDQQLANAVAKQIQMVCTAIMNQQKRRKDDSGSTEEDKIIQQFSQFSSYHVQRWPLEPYLSEDATPSTIQPHPHPVKALAREEWDGMLRFAGTETDQSSPGVMEGAIGSAYRVLKEMRITMTDKTKSQE